MKILLPLDVANPYEQYLKQLERLLPLDKTDVLVLYVADSGSGLESVLSSMGKAAEEMDKNIKERAEKILSEVTEKLQNKCRSAIFQITSGRAASTIESVANSESIDLIAIGATRELHAPFMSLGSTAAHVVKHAQGTVLILREGPGKENLPLKALVAVDGSEQAFKALRTFASQFDVLQQKVSVTILNVVSIVGVWKFVSPVEFVAAIEDNLNMAAETILAQSDKILSEYQIAPADMIVRTGEAAEEIMKAARDINADLVVVGAQGKSTVEEFFLGSASHKLSLHGPCSTVVVK